MTTFFGFLLLDSHRIYRPVHFAECGLYLIIKSNLLSSN